MEREGTRAPVSNWREFNPDGCHSVDELARRIYKGIVDKTAKQGYRPDLRQEAVGRASAILLSQQPKKDLPEKKLRGSKARAASTRKS